MGAYLSLSGSGREVGWALINFFRLEDGRLFEVGANSNKYGTCNIFLFCKPHGVSFR